MTKSKIRTSIQERCPDAAANRAPGASWYHRHPERIEINESWVARNELPWGEASIVRNPVSSASDGGGVNTRRCGWSFVIQNSDFIRHWLGFNRSLSLALGLSFGLLLFPGALLGFTNSRPNDIPPLRPPRKEIPPSFWEQHGALIIVSGVVLLGLICVGVWFARRARPQVMVPPEVQARAALEAIRGQPETGAVLSAVSQNLRHYFTGAFNLPPEELTTTEFCELIARNEAIGPPLATAISEFLRHGDQRKFALSADSQPLEAVPQAFRIIEMAEARRAELRRVQQNSETAKS